VSLELHSPAARGLRRYVRLVAAALAPAVECSVVHWDQPVNAYLTLAGRLHWFPGRSVALTWDSRHGWAMVLTTCGGERLITLRYLGDDMLPAPDDVAEFSCRLFRDELAGWADPPRAAEDVTERLARYATPHHRPHRQYYRAVHLYGVVTSHPGRA
jgi:hypothetical protein